MGFFQDLVKPENLALNALTMGNAGTIRAGLYNNPAAPPGTTDRRHTFVPRTSMSQQVSDLINPIYNTEGARQYGNTFDQAYEQLNQPLRDVGRDDVYVAGTRALASAFADRVLTKTGSLPTEDQVRQFVSQTLTPGFAQKFITGIAPDQINATADQYIQGNPDALTNPGTKSAEEQRLSGLSAQLDKLYNTGRESLVKGYDESVYGPGKTRTVNDLAGQGMLTQPNSRYALNQLEANRGRDISSGLTTLEGQRAQGNIDVSGKIEDILQRNRDRSQNAYQFNQSFNANRDDNAFNQGLQRKQLTVAEQLGRLQAKGREPGTLDYINSAIGGAGAAASVAKLFCWVAVELYGESDKTKQIRQFLLNRINEDSLIGKFARKYAERGEQWAEMIKKDGSLRNSFRRIYDGFYKMALKEDR